MELPLAFGNLTELSVLMMTGVNVARFPDSFTTMTSLEFLTIDRRYPEDRLLEIHPQLIVDCAEDQSESSDEEQEPDQSYVVQP